MSNRFVHRLLQSRRALSPFGRSYSPVNIPPETSMVSTAFSNAFSFSSCDPNTFTSSSPAKPPPAASTSPTLFSCNFSSTTTTGAGRRSRDKYIQSLLNNSRFPNLAEYWKNRLRLEKEAALQEGVRVVVKKVTEEMAKHSRSMRLLLHLLKEIEGRNDLDMDQIAQIRQLSAMVNEHLKLSTAFEEGGEGFEDFETEDDWEIWGDERLEKLRKMNESISEINVFAKRIIASPPQPEKKETWIYPVMVLLLLLVLISPVKLDI